MKTQRLDQHLTQEELALRCGSSDQVMRSYEKNRNKPGYDMLVRLCDALHVNPDYLMQDDLSFNPYADKDEALSSMQTLPPADYQLVKDMIASLQNRRASR